jgi:hypothetical protein
MRYGKILAEIFVFFTIFILLRIFSKKLRYSGPDKRDRMKKKSFFQNKSQKHKDIGDYRENINDWTIFAKMKFRGKG